MQLAGPDGDHSGHDRCTMQMRTLRHVAIAAFAVLFVLLFIRARWRSETRTRILDRSTWKGTTSPDAYPQDCGTSPTTTSTNSTCSSVANDTQPMGE